MIHPECRGHNVNDVPLVLLRDEPRRGSASVRIAVLL